MWWEKLVLAVRRRAAGSSGQAASAAGRLAHRSSCGKKVEKEVNKRRDQEGEDGRSGHVPEDCSIEEK
jgi:hypothetical protein